MARNFAKLYVGIWTDERFKQLSSQAQRLYTYVFSQQRLDSAGTMVWQPLVAAKAAPDLTLETVESAMHELRQGRYVVLDDDTGLLAIRSYVKNDQILANSKSTTALVKAWETLDSDLLKSVIAHEVHRIADANPQLSGLKHCETVLEYPLIDPWELPIPEQG